MKKTFFLMLSLGLLLVACQKEEIGKTQVKSSSLDQEITKRSSNQIFQAREHLTKTISCYVSNCTGGNTSTNSTSTLGNDGTSTTSSTTTTSSCALLVLFEELCLATNNNGHYEIEFFFNVEKDIPRQSLGGQSIKQVLVNIDPTVEQSLDYLCSNDPGLSILLVPQRTPEQGGYNSKIFFDDNFDDMDPNAIVGFYENCIRNTRSYSIEPVTTTFVVRECESYIPSNQIGLTANQASISGGHTANMGTSCGQDITVFLNGSNSPIIYDPNPFGDGPGTLEQRDSCPSRPWDRDDEWGADNIDWISITHDYEGWGKGKSEFRFFCLLADDAEYEVDEHNELIIAGDPFAIVTKSCNSIKDNGERHYVDLDIFWWDEYLDSDKIKIAIYEHDVARKIDEIELKEELKIKAKVGVIEYEDTKTASAKFSITAKSDHIGDVLIPYCSPFDFTYRPSNNFEMRLNRRQN